MHWEKVKIRRKKINKHKIKWEHSATTIRNNQSTESTESPAHIKLEQKY
jgi:hypothetical protein